jgi:hypothetical protein
MKKVWYFIPQTQCNWETEAESDFDAIEAIKLAEGIKRVPPTWKIWIWNDDKGEMIEINRRAIARHRAEAMANARQKVQQS